MSASILLALAIAAAPPAVADPDVAALRQQLLASQQQVATLRRELADQTGRAASLDQCRAKNSRLVAIGNDLIAASAKRYRGSHRDPLQLGRRRFEAELQDKSDAIYDSRVDVPVRPVPPVASR